MPELRKSIVLEKLRNNKTVFCFKNVYADPNIVELMGYLDIDVAWICNEHLAINPEKLQELTRAGRASGIDVMIRQDYSSYSELIKPLEMGAAGLMIPHCINAKMAEEIVSHTKFHPDGKRGFDGVSGDSYFGTVPPDDYIKHANSETFLMLQIEDVEAIEEIDAIAAVKGVDIIFVGPADLSHSLGCPGDFKNAEIQNVIEKVIRACQRNNIWSATSGLDLEYSKYLLDLGINFITCGSDYGMIKKGFDEALNNFQRLIR